MARIRREEMARAREILGVEQRFLGFVDSGLPEGDPKPPLPEGCFAAGPAGRGGGPAGARGARIPAARDPDLRRERRVPAPGPHQDPSGRGGGVRGGGGPRPVPEEAASPGSRSRCTTSSRSTRRSTSRCTRSCCAAAWTRRTPRSSRSGRSAPASAPSAASGSWRSPRGSRWPTTSRSGIEALLAHATQIDPNSSWFACPLEVQRAAWPTEDYHLARSLVDTELPEDDLFAGVLESVSL